MSTLKLGVIGNPISHSLSPWIHGQFARQAKINIEYIKIKPELNQFCDAVEQFQKNGGYGFNITSPFKQQAYQHATQITARAETAKSVNTILLRDDGEIMGDNTDGEGFLRDVLYNLNYCLTGKIIVILGAGGAARGILHPLLMQSPEKIIIANRTLQTAQSLVNEFSIYGSVLSCAFENLNHINADVVIDSTGFDAKISLPHDFSLSENSLCYDFKYGKKPTLVMQWAQKKNVKIIADGLGMLVEQAAESFYLWTHYKPETQSVIALAKKF